MLKVFVRVCPALYVVAVLFPQQRYPTSHDRMRRCSWRLVFRDPVPNPPSNLVLGVPYPYSLHTSIPRLFKSLKYSRPTRSDTKKKIIKRGHCMAMRIQILAYFYIQIQTTGSHKRDAEISKGNSCVRVL